MKSVADSSVGGAMDNQGRRSRSSSRNQALKAAPTTKMSTAYREPRRSIFDLGRSAKRAYTSSFGSSSRFGEPPPPAVRSSASRFSSLAHKGTAAWAAAAASSTVEIYQRLQVETGWPEDAMGKRYAQVTEYRLPLEEDLDNETYVDIVNRQGQPYIRNVGILRYLGPVRFDSGTWWAGIEMDSHPVPGGNDGCLEGRRYFECDTGLGMFIPQRYCRRSFLQRSRHDANANNGAFSRLRLDHRGVWLVEEMTNFEPPSSIQSLRELGVEPYVHVPRQEAAEGGDEEGGSQGGRRPSRLLAALAARFTTLEAISEAGRGEEPKQAAGVEVEDDLDSSDGARTVDEAYVADPVASQPRQEEEEGSVVDDEEQRTTDLLEGGEEEGGKPQVVVVSPPSQGEGERVGGPEEEEEEEGQRQQPLPAEASQPQAEGGQLDALVVEEEGRLAGEATQRVGGGEVAAGVEGTVPAVEGAAEEEGLFQELLGSTHDDERPASAPAVAEEGTVIQVQIAVEDEEEEGQWWRMDDEGEQQSASPPQLPAGEPTAPQDEALLLLYEEEAPTAAALAPLEAATPPTDNSTPLPPEQAPLTSTVALPLPEASATIPAPQAEQSAEEELMAIEPSRQGEAEGGQHDPAATRSFAPEQTGAVDDDDDGLLMGWATVQEPDSSAAAAETARLLSAPPPTVWLDSSSSGQDAELYRLEEEEEQQQQQEEEGGATSDAFDPQQTVAPRIWLDDSHLVAEARAREEEDGPLVPSTPAPTMWLEDQEGGVFSRSQRNIHFSPKAVQVTFTPRRQSKELAAGTQIEVNGQGKGQEGGGRAWGEEEAEEEEAWAAFTGMELADVDIKPGASPRQERRARWQQQQQQQQAHPLHRRSRSVSEGGKDRGAAGGRKERRGHGRSATSVTPPPQLSSLQATVAGDGAGNERPAEKLVGPAELETYYLAAKLYLEEQGVGWDDASEAAAFSRKTLFLRLNNIDPQAGATPKAAKGDASPVKTVGA